MKWCATCGTIPHQVGCPGAEPQREDCGGNGCGDCRECDRLAYNEVEAERQRVTARVEALEDGLADWWRSRRPVGWTHEQHAANPTINLGTPTERLLARLLVAEAGALSARAALSEEAGA
jgi:hypothetical protein